MDFSLYGTLNLIKRVASKYAHTQYGPTMDNSIQRSVFAFINGEV